MSMYATILFDLDGTLTDPKQGITKSVQYALKKLNIIEEDLDKLEAFIGPPLMDSFMEEYALTEVEAKQAVAYYREYFKEKGIYENELYAGIPQLLESLCNQGRQLIVATSKPTVFAEIILKYFQIDKYFTWVCGSNLDGTLVDKTEIIQYILEQKNCQKEATIMIGDRKFDLIGAHNNRIASIAVGYGYGSEEELLNSNPTHYIKTIQELENILSLRNNNHSK
ncbi:MAG: HAD family hydrolase [Gorillibacterium sp.]|nr:HAD family hydrolase [Gorillibacterium sp.]